MLQEDKRRIVLTDLINYLKYSEDITDINIEEFLMNITDEEDYYLIQECNIIRNPEFDSMDYDIVGVYKYKNYCYTIYHSFIGYDSELLIECKEINSLLSKYYIQVIFYLDNNTKKEDFVSDEINKVYEEHTSKNNYISYKNKNIDKDILQIITNNLQNSNLSYDVCEQLMDLYPNKTMQLNEYDNMEDYKNIYEYYYNERFEKLINVFSCKDSRIKSHGNMSVSIYQNKNNEDIIIDLTYGYEGSIITDYIIISDEIILDRYKEYEDNDYDGYTEKLKEKDLKYQIESSFNE